MLHLFNKVYLEHDDNIEINFDRVVISETHGHAMLQMLDKVAYGALHKHGTSYEDVVGDNFVDFVHFLNDAGFAGQRIIIYCDNDAYDKVMGSWFKLILPNLDKESFKSLVEHTIYNQRILSNSWFVEQPEDSVWVDTDAENLWDITPKFSEEDRDRIKSFELNYSYEFLVSSYLDDYSNVNEFKTTLHMFLRRWWEEILDESRLEVLASLSNHHFVSYLNIDSSLIDITAADPIKNVKDLVSYSDPKIWNKDKAKSGRASIEGLSVTKSNKLFKTFEFVTNYPGQNIDFSKFNITKDFLQAACSTELSDEMFLKIVEYIVDNPIEGCFISKPDMLNVNYVLLQHFLSIKSNDGDLSKYKLL